MYATLCGAGALRRVCFLLGSLGPADMSLLLVATPHDCERAQVSWYNELVEEKYAIDADGDVVALALVSTPAMWTSFKSSYGTKNYPSDPVDTWCRESIFAGSNQVALELPDLVRRERV